MAESRALSQWEIDALLNQIPDGEAEGEDPAEGASAPVIPQTDRAFTRTIKSYDFRRPDKFSKEQWHTLQSVKSTHVGFPLLEPFLFYPEYGFELPDSDASILGLKGPEDALVRCVLTLREDAEETTANLLAPIILNRRTRQGRQVVLQEIGRAHV